MNIMNIRCVNELVILFFILVSLPMNLVADEFYKPVTKVSTAQQKPVLVEDVTPTEYGEGKYQEYFATFCKKNMTKEQIDEMYKKDPKLKVMLDRMGKNSDYIVSTCAEINKDIVIRGKEKTDKDGNVVDESFR